MRAVLLATALTSLAAAPASAVPVGFQFRVALTSGPLAGETLRGTFAVDSGLIGAGDVFDYSAAGLGIDSIDFTIGRVDFARANSDALYLSFHNGHLLDFSLGGLTSGVDQIDSLNDTNADFDVSGAGVNYKLGGSEQFIYSGDTVAFGAVPEPTMIALFGLGLGCLTARRERARRNA